ncbi:MAG: hypothetical protein ACOYZ7_03860 [Chloroflexota bacterium]
MSSIPLPYPPHPTIAQEKIDRLGWMDGQSFTAYGLRFGLWSNTPASLEQAAPHLPLGWQPVPGSEADILYALYLDPPNYHLYCDSALIGCGPELLPILRLFQQHAAKLTAYRAQDCLFVHAGVVGWQGQAILIPGRSMSGKSTLVKALVESGATYYSDEFAVLDKQGHVHAYPLPLSIREADGQPARKTPIESLGGQTGIEPLPVGLVVVTRYQPRARWRPQTLSPAQALLALMDNTVAARREPTYSMPILREVAMAARVVQSKRGDAKRVALALLQLLR